MHLRRATAAVLLLLPAFSAEAASDKLEICMSCHGETGVSEMPGVPSLAGKPAQYLAAQLQAYRDQTRQNPQMLLARRLADAEIAEFAAYFAAQKPAVPAKPAGTDAAAK